jgi:hypothetical protein
VVVGASGEQPDEFGGDTLPCRGQLGRETHRAGRAKPRLDQERAGRATGAGGELEDLVVQAAAAGEEGARTAHGIVLVHELGRSGETDRAGRPSWSSSRSPARQRCGRLGELAREPGRCDPDGCGARGGAVAAVQAPKRPGA